MWSRSIEAARGGDWGGERDQTTNKEIEQRSIVCSQMVESPLPSDS